MNYYWDANEFFKRVFDFFSRIDNNHNQYFATMVFLLAVFKANKVRILILNTPSSCLAGRHRLAQLVKLFSIAYIGVFRFVKFLLFHKQGYTLLEYIIYVKVIRTYRY